MTNALRQTVFLVALALLWFAAARATVRFAGAVFAPSQASVGTARSAHLDSLVREALQPGPEPRSAQFLGTHVSPFRPQGASAPSEGVTHGTPHERTPFSLNGLLLESTKPQAILEDASGGTHIAGEGDTVLGQRVMKIERDQVTIRDRSGVYTVRVKE